MEENQVDSQKPIKASDAELERPPVSCDSWL